MRFWADNSDYRKAVMDQNSTPANPAPITPLSSFDARVWARSFIEHNKIDPSIARDEETMVTWFANALMRGYDEYANIDWVKRAGRARALLFESQAVRKT